ncbi:nucleotide-diphospho-sugar transferase [Thelonectria olida]|uniref:Nucleotide-diphospho-sugar transferase n=1 Tax=Thelonectria olida TaxID=1576542 RepID=A0A9P8W6D1_9HYPO|nr:nucleotide-diphospho-sugar transferase [Thelonectria olida]
MNPSYPGPGRRRSSVVANVAVPTHLMPRGIRTTSRRDKFPSVPESGPVQEAIRAHIEHVRSVDYGRNNSIAPVQLPQAVHFQEVKFQDVRFEKPPQKRESEPTERPGEHVSFAPMVHPSHAEHVSFAPLVHPSHATRKSSMAPAARAARKPSMAPIAMKSPFASRNAGRTGSDSGTIDMDDPAARPSVNYATEKPPRGMSFARSKSFAHSMQSRARRLSHAVRRSSIWDVYETAKRRGVEIQRKPWAMVVFEYAFYFFLVALVYFVIIGMPLWKGSVWWLYWLMENKFSLTAGFTIPIGVAALYAFAPLLVLFEKDPPPYDPTVECDPINNPGVATTALLIPCYKSAGLIAATLDSAIKIFPPSHIFVVANGNSPTPLDNTEEVCAPYGVNHIWSPIGCKLVAQFVGCYAAKEFKDVLMIDDDCKLPPNFPVVSDRLTGNVKSIGYTIKSTGPNSSLGTLCQQAQDLEYKISGLQRLFAGAIGSATFPHGAISLWDREFLVSVFYDHPGFSVSEDWFFGDSCRKLGGRIKMCSSVFVETETPDAIFKSSGSERGGFGEMTVFKQRFMRWNFFFVNGMWYNMAYIFRSWSLGWWELGAKLFVFQEAYETLLYLLAPFVLPVAALIRPQFLGILTAVTIAIYLVNVIIFNEVHLRLKRERVTYKVLILYYMPYKIILAFVNIASCYWSIFKYARYFAKRHLKVVEDEKAVEVILQIRHGDFDPLRFHKCHHHAVVRPVHGEV